MIKMKNVGATSEYSDVIIAFCWVALTTVVSLYSLSIAAKKFKSSKKDSCAPLKRFGGACTTKARRTLW